MSTPRRASDLASVFVLFAALVVATFLFTGACSSGATPVCGPDSGCAPDIPDGGFGDVSLD